MWISKVSDLIGSSPESFEAAAAHIVARAHETLRGITGFEILHKSIKTEGSRVIEYRVRVRLSFDLAPQTDLHL